AMVEKNLTMSRQNAGPEQSTAVEPDDAGRYVKRMHQVWEALGRPRKTITPEERRGRAAARRCAFTNKYLKSGDVIGFADFTWARPAADGGFEPPQINHLIGRTLRHSLPKGAPILDSDLA